VSFTLEHWRAAIFCGAFLSIALAETLWPCRRLRLSTAQRWIGNFLLLGLGMTLIKVLPDRIGDVATISETLGGWGLLARIALPEVPRLLLGVLILDISGYLAHRLVHRVPWLWRLHAVHHADLDLDVTTAIRHHPLELVALLPVTAATIVLFGIPPLAILVYGAAVAAVQFVHHGNIALPASFDRWLRYLVVTPSLHRLHHSMDCADGNSNFADLLPLWDRLFGTLRTAPHAGETRFAFGLSEFGDAASNAPHRLLAMPFLPRNEVRPTR
jgi:sterol desaturase/sphingolipid hydroxylase (fatty acid hydroxylase superfamily)